MKKTISLLLVLVFMLALSTAAYAEDGQWDPNIVGSDGHLHTCGGGDCDCLDILISAEREYKALHATDNLRVIISSTNAKGERADTVIAEILPAYNNAMVQENGSYLDANGSVKALLSEFYGEKNLAKDLYRPTGFIDSQLIGSYWYLLEKHEREHGGCTEMEYRLMTANITALSGLKMGVYEEGKDAGEGKKFVFSREKVGDERYSPLEYEVALKAGEFYIRLPQGYGDKGFSLGLSFNDNGSVRVLLADEEAKLIPGAEISIAVDKAAGDAELCLLEGGKLSAVEDASFAGDRVTFTAPSGDDVFVLSKK